MTECCKHCGQTLPSIAPPFQMANLTRLIYERVARAGSSGISSSTLIDHIYSGHENGGPLTAEKLLQVMICKLNRRLREHGEEISQVSVFRGFYALRKNIRSATTLTRTELAGLVQSIREGRAYSDIAVQYRIRLQEVTAIARRNHCTKRTRGNSRDLTKRRAKGDNSRKINPEQSVVGLLHSENW